jgi:hypothetical protein
VLIGVGFAYVYSYRGEHVCVERLCLYLCNSQKILIMVMLRVLRPARANRRTLLQSHRIIACAFTLPLALLMSLLKKSPILIPSASSSPIAALCGCPVLDADAHSPPCCRAPHLPPRVHTPRTRLSPPHVRHATRSLPSRALVRVVLALLVARAACPIDPSLVLVAVVLARAAGAGC